MSLGLFGAHKERLPKTKIRRYFFSEVLHSKLAFMGGQIRMKILRVGVVIYTLYVGKLCLELEIRRVRRDDEPKNTL